MDKYSRIAILSGVLVIVGLFTWGIVDINIQQNKIQKALKQSAVFDGNTLKDINKVIDLLNKKIDILPQKEAFNKLLLEKKLQQVNVMVRNKTLGTLGSGVTLKYKDKFYILSAGHMIDKLTDKMLLFENEQQIDELEIVKHEHTIKIAKMEGILTVGNDLTLFRVKDSNIHPQFYVELADYEPLTATEVYIVGNPLGIEDVVSEGRIIVYRNNFMYYIDHTYFGNSGGGVYTKDGKLIGIVSHMIALQPEEHFTPYMINGAVRLSVIKTFLGDID